MNSASKDHLLIRLIAAVTTGPSNPQRLLESSLPIRMADSQVTVYIVSEQ
jgi:hypothetical protein